MVRFEQPCAFIVHLLYDSEGGSRGARDWGLGATGCWFLVAGSWLLVAGRSRLPPASCLLPPASCRLHPASCILPPASRFPGGNRSTGKAPEQAEAGESHIRQAQLLKTFGVFGRVKNIEDGHAAAGLEYPRDFA
jgi:hypothetical protein